jgi:hypothetical protein
MTSPTLLKPSMPLTDDQAYCRDLLREALALADAGKVNSLCMVVCMEGGFATVMGGRRGADLHVGCHDLQAKILAELTGGNVARPKPRGSSIIQVKP